VTKNKQVMMFVFVYANILCTAERFNTIEALEECPNLQKWVKYAAKQRPTTVQGRHAKLRYKK